MRHDNFQKYLALTVMKIKTKKEVSVRVKVEKSNNIYSEKLIQEVKESLKDYKDGNYYKGTADEVIKKLHDEANKVKKV